MFDPTEMGGHVRLFAAAVAIAFGVDASAAAAEPGSANPSLTKRWMFTAGAAYNDPNAEVSSRILSTGAGGSVDLSDIGADDGHVSPLFALRWRPNARWRLDFSYQSLEIDGRRGATSQIDFADISIPVGWDVRSELSTHMYSATLGYAFYGRPNAEVGGLIGLHVLDAKAAIEGSVFVGPARLSRAAQISHVVPVPTLGIYGTYAMTDRLAFEGKAQYLRARYAEYSGEVLVLSAAANYWFLKSTSLTLGYRFTDINVTRDGNRTRDSYSIGFGGPYAAVSIAF